MTQYIYGLHAVTALLENQPDIVQSLIVQQGRDDVPLQHLRKQALADDIAVTESSRQELDKLFADAVVHQGVVAACLRLPTYSTMDLPSIIEPVEGPKLVLILDGVQDPHNLGACLRVANGLGACCVIAPKDKAVGLTETAIKVSTGAAFSTPFVQVTNLVRTMKQLQAMGIWLVGTDAEVKQSVNEIDMRGDIAIVMGAEGKGLRRLTRETCDYLAHIPMLGNVESLNVSVATGICLYEVMSQRQQTLPLREAK